VISAPPSESPLASAGMAFAHADRVSFPPPGSRPDEYSPHLSTRGQSAHRKRCPPGRVRWLSVGRLPIFLKLHNLWEGIFAIPPPLDYCWWKPEASDPAQFELQVPHWSPDFEFQEWHYAADSAESSDDWQAQEIPLDADTILILDSDPPVQDDFPEFLYD
jgi:hypothetical protein